MCFFTGFDLTIECYYILPWWLNRGISSWILPTVSGQPPHLITGHDKDTIMHYYKFNLDAYASHTAHLEPMEDLAYRRMLDLYYRTEAPLPSEVEQIAKLIRMRTHCDCIESVLREFFVLESDGYHNTGADKELGKVYQRSASARASAEARWNKKNNKNKDLKKDANAMRTQCESDANGMLPKTELLTTEDSIKGAPAPVKSANKNLKLVDFKNAGLPNELCEDFIQHRKNKKAPVTRTAMRAICQEAVKANMTLEEVLQEMLNRGWTGFKADWVNDQKTYIERKQDYLDAEAKVRFKTLLSATPEELDAWGLN